MARGGKSSSMASMVLVMVMLLLAMAVYLAMPVEAARELMSHKPKCLGLEYACTNASQCCSGWCDGLCY